MKSIMEEASSIIKAIEKAWIQAGQPQEFSIKIFEEPQKNFIGMTIRSAKVGIFFADSTPQKPKKAKALTVPVAASPVKTTKPELKRAPKKPEIVSAPPVPHVTPVTTPTITPITTDLPTGQTKPIVWSDPMVQDVQQWLARTLELLHKPTGIFTLQPSHFHLKITFSEPIFDDKNREKQLFSSLATLFLQMLKQKYKRPLRGYKIILISSL